MPRSSIPPRLRVFLGCEGESERSYGALLNRLLPKVYIETAVLRGGDPLSLVKRAITRIDERERKRSPFAVRAVLLDSDQLGQVPDRDAQISAAARRAGLQLIWQRPCHEALLLRHFQGCGQRRPQTPALAIEELIRHWPQYMKGTSAVELSRQIGEQELRQVLPVEPELGTFLRALGLC